MVFNQIPKKDTHQLLTDDVVHILDTIEKSGYEARLVGGSIRNWLLGSKISDVDIATTALPAQIMKIFEKVVPSGIEHGTVTIVYKGKGYEITTLREDVETFGRKAQVAFCKSFEKDSNRRDFTINALYMDRNGAIYDYHDGIADISNRTVRFIGNPEKRIREDYLRILRYFRFVSYYGDFKCSKKYLDVIYALKSKLCDLSSERILSEILKIFALKNAYKIMGVMKPIMEELFVVTSSEEILLFCCEKLCESGIQKLDSNEKLALVLKFSEGVLQQTIQKYKFSKQIKRKLKLEATSEDIESIWETKKHLKKIHKNDRHFFAVYRTIKKGMKLGIFKDLRVADIPTIDAADANSKQKSEKNADSAIVSALLSELLSEYRELEKFCESGEADFSFRASYLDQYALDPKKLAEVMKSIKEIWMKSAEPLEKSNYAKIAESIIENL